MSFGFYFPFILFSQLILDQRQCKGESSTDPGAGGGGKCLLPNNQHQPPYYPCKNGILPDNALDGKQCPQEHVQGPDWFTYMLHLSRSLSRDIYSIIVGETWITADSQLLKIEKDLKKAKKGKNNSTTTNETKMEGGSKAAAKKENVRDQIERRKEIMNNTESGQTSNPSGARLFGVKNKTLSKTATGIDIAITEMEKSLGFSQTTFRSGFTLRYNFGN